MTPSLLREIGQALDGPWFVRRLAERRGVAARTIERWLAGTSPIPDGMPSEIASDLEAKIAELRELRKKLR